ncbi:MAG TPA: GNAT family N-acetyltransferase [Actinomycetes bacterium]
MLQTQMEIRGARPVDRDALRGFLSALSPRTAYLRFFAGIGIPSSAFVRRLLAPGPDRGAWVATEGDRIVGHAFWARPSGVHDAAELAVVVADEHQGRGIGSPLVRAAVLDAAATGVSRLILTVLAENRRVTGMVARHWPAATPERDGPLLAYLVPVPASLVPAPRPALADRLPVPA